MSAIGDGVLWRATDDLNAQALADVLRDGPELPEATVATKEPGAPDPRVLRQALFAWAFNPATRGITPPPHIAAVHAWA